MLVNRIGFLGLKLSRFVFIELSKIGNFIIYNNYLNYIKDKDEIKNSVLVLYDIKIFKFFLEYWWDFRYSYILIVYGIRGLYFFMWL